MNEVLNRRHVLAKAEQLRLFHVKPTVNRVAERLSSALGIPVASLARQRASCVSNAPPGQPEPEPPSCIAEDTHIPVTRCAFRSL